MGKRGGDIEDYMGGFRLQWLQLLTTYVWMQDIMM